MPPQSGPLLRELCGVLCPSPHTLRLPAALRLLPFPAELLQESPWFPRRRSRRPEPTLPRCWEAATTHPGIRPTSSSPFALTTPPPAGRMGRRGEHALGRLSSVLCFTHCLNDPPPLRQGLGSRRAALAHGEWTPGPLGSTCRCAFLHQGQGVPRDGKARGGQSPGHQCRGASPARAASLPGRAACFVVWTSSHLVLWVQPWGPSSHRTEPGNKEAKAGSRASPPQSETTLPGAGSPSFVQGQMRTDLPAAP